MPNPIKVLIADDEREFLDSLAKVLGRRGIVVVKASDGREAVERRAAEPFDVIVLDLRMPVMDGLNALREIRKADPLTPILILSGHSDLAFVTEALKTGAAEYLLKPCPVETLVSAIETAHERRTIAQELAAKLKK